MNEVDFVPVEITSLQYLKEKMTVEVDFLPEEKHQKCLQSDTVLLGVCGQACPNDSKYKFAISLQILRKK